MEAAVVLRCESTDENMLALLPQVDAYIQQATGRDWTVDSPISPVAKSAARMLLVMWHENPGMIGNMSSLNFGLTSALVQLESLALRYVTFEGLDGAGYIEIPNVVAGTTVSSVVGVVGVSGDQHTNFESVITEDGYIYQSSTSDLSSKWYRAYLVPPEVK
jgi:hypothetical protein